MAGDHIVKIALDTYEELLQEKVRKKNNKKTPPPPPPPPLDNVQIKADLFLG